MRKFLLGLTASVLLAAAPAAFAQSNPGEGPVPKSLVKAGVYVPPFNHVFVVMMENHLLSEVIGNANAPFMSSLAANASASTQYYGVGHPSLVNYLELLGGSNFGVNNDTWPNWIKGGCVDNAPGSTSCAGAVPALSGTLTDEAIPATADASNGNCNNQISAGSSGAVSNNCARQDYAAETVGARTIADQLVAAGKTWKAYEQSLPTINSPAGKVNFVDGVNYSDGSYTNLQPASFFTSTTPATVIPKLYAVKHNPFVYFQNVQQGTTPGVSESQIADFDSNLGLYADLAANSVPNFSFIVPNQCLDIHKLPGTETECNDDPQTMLMADANMNKLVTAIEASKAWKTGFNSIVILFDENDYSNNANVVPFIVVKNYGSTVQSSVPYDHYSLLRTIEDGFRLPCLNHACDATVPVMGDLFNSVK